MPPAPVPTSSLLPPTSYLLRLNHSNHNDLSTSHPPIDRELTGGAYSALPSQDFLRSNEHTEQDQRCHRCRPGSRTGHGHSAPEETPPVGAASIQNREPGLRPCPSKKLHALVPRGELSFGEKLVPWIRWPISIAGGDRTSGGTNRRHLIDDRRVVRLTPRTSFILTRNMAQ